MSDETKLRAAAADIDVVDLAGRVVANPARNALAVSTAGTLALSLAFEATWAIALETEILIRALKLPITGDGEEDEVRAFAIQSQIDVLDHLLAPIRKPKSQE